MSKLTEKTSKNLRELLSEPERKAVKGTEPKGLLSQTLSGEELGRALEDAIIADNVGSLLKTAREQRQRSARSAADSVGVSHPRILAVERGGSRIECSTLVRHADALGYEVTVSLRPKQGRGRHIVANLTPDEVEATAP